MAAAAGKGAGDGMKRRPATQRHRERAAERQWLRAEAWNDREPRRERRPEQTRRDASVTDVVRPAPRMSEAAAVAVVVWRPGLPDPLVPAERARCAAVARAAGREARARAIELGFLTPRGAYAEPSPYAPAGDDAA